jgi:hypothetical protein
MMSKNFIKRVPITKIWICAITTVLIPIIFTLGCYKKLNEPRNTHFEDQAEQRMTISEKDLNKFGSSMKIIDGEAESHYKMALYFQKRKKHKFAIEELKKAVQLNPLFTEAYNAMGVSYDKLGNYSQAANCYRSALKLSPKLDYAHNNLGYSYLLKNDLDAAIDAFKKAIELNDSNKRYHSNLGLAYIMKGQYDKAYAQFRIVDGDAGAKVKLVNLLDRLGKEKPDHDFTKYSNSEPHREKSVNKTPVIIRRKIHDNETKSLIKADHSVHKAEDQEMNDAQISIGNNEAFLNPDKDAPQNDETGIIKRSSSHSSEKNSEITGVKKVKSLESIDRHAHRELQSVSKHASQTAYSESNEEDAAENKISETVEYPIHISIAEDQKPSTTNEKAGLETKTDILKAKDSSVFSDRMYSLSSVELFSDPVSEKISSAESVKSEISHHEAAKNRTQNTVEPKVVEVDEPYYQDIKGTASVTPAKYKDTNSDLAGKNQINLKEKQSSVYSQAEPTNTPADRNTGGEIFQNGTFQSNNHSNLASKDKSLIENSKSGDINVKIEIIVANGNGVNGAAGRLRTYLKSKGFKVAKVINANSFDHTSTKIFYCNGGKKDVYRLLQQIPFVLDQRSIIELKNLKNRFKIIIGKDQIKHDKIFSKTTHGKPHS